MSLAERLSRGVTRRTFLRALGFAVASAFTAIADELDRLMRWCCFGGNGGGLRYAGAA